MKAAVVSPSIVTLEEARDVRDVGGKAHALARVVSLGLPVPEALVLPCVAFEAWLTETGLVSEINALWERIDAADPAASRAAAHQIRTMVLATTLPVTVDEAVTDAAARLLRSGPVAVRSSAVGEDGEYASFAGQLDSILDVSTVADVRRAVLTCWASYWSDRALSYRRLRQVSLQGMAVIIQRQVPAVAAGVIFTREPVADARRSCEDLLIEYCAGLGDRLVSGEADPGRVRITRTDLAVATLQELPDPVRRDQVGRILSADRLRELARMAILLEHELGGPQDVEWALDAQGRLWILQARPITTLRPPAQPDAGRATVWTNANINENFPDPVCPLLYSIASVGYYHYFRNLGLAFGISRRRLAAMDRPLRAIIGVHGARMYYNLTHIHSVLRMAPVGEKLAAAFNEFVGADRMAASPPGSASWSDKRHLVAHGVEVARIAMRTTWQYLFLRHRLESFERTADAFASRTTPEILAKRSLPELTSDLADFLDIRCHRWKNASLTDAAAMVSYALLQRCLAGAGLGATVHNRLLRALPGVPSSVPPLELWRLSRQIRANEWLAHLFATADSPTILATVRTDPRAVAFLADFERFLRDWGFRSSAELMLTVPSLEEQPLPVIDLLRQYASSDGEPPASIMARQAAERRSETAQLLGRLVLRSPIRALLVWRFLGWTQRSVAYRERARLKQALLYTRCRRVALAIGARLADTGVLEAQDDVFFLTWQEIDELGSGRAMFPHRVTDLVTSRRHEHRALSLMQVPDTFQLADGEYLPLGTVVGTGSDPVPTREAAHTLLGVSACGGQVTARAAVLADVGEASRLSRGDVLVTRQTDPGWGPLFCLVSGLVIERGGMLSHGAIIAREFGLPCVVGVKDATRLVTHGVRVTVDGDRGTCTLIGTSA